METKRNLENDIYGMQDLMTRYLSEHPLTDEDRAQVSRQYEASLHVTLSWDKARWVWENAPRRLRDDILRDAIYTQAQSYAVSQISRRKKDAVIFGANGSGKSLVGWRVVADALDARRTARLVTAMDLIEQAKSVMASCSPSAWLDAHYGSGIYQLLVIDEVAKRSMSTWETSLLQIFLDKRYEDFAQTVAIGNFSSAEDAADSIGQSAFDRLTDAETGICVALEGASFRRGR